MVAIGSGPVFPGAAPAYGREDQHGRGGSDFRDARRGLIDLGAAITLPQSYESAVARVEVIDSGSKVIQAGCDQVDFNRVESAGTGGSPEGDSPSRQRLLAGNTRRVVKNLSQGSQVQRSRGIQVGSRVRYSSERRISGGLDAGQRELWAVSVDFEWQREVRPVKVMEILTDAFP